ncbi:TPA: hypothetical protein ACGW5B_005835 [Bacillus paranthracis]
MKIISSSNKKKNKYVSPSNYSIFKKLYLFMKSKFWDAKHVKKDKFNEYGLTIFCGMQGYGKTISLVEKLEEIRHKYPDVIICTNFGYKHQDYALTDWLQILELRNDAGIVFAIDEIQNEFDLYDSRNFNMRILRTVTQQRKQGIKMYGTSQVYTRVTKPLREQTFEVVECFTMFGRWTFQKCFDADTYNLVVDNPEKKAKIKRKWRKNFVQSNFIRSLFDSYAVVDEMAKLEREHRQKNA